MRRKLFIALGGFLLGLLFYYVYNTISKPVLKIGYIRITDHLILGVAKLTQKDKFKRFKLVTEQFDGWDQLADNFVNGDLDGVFVLAPLAMSIREKFHAKNERAKILLLGHRAGSVLIVGNKSGINKLSDLKGKRIGIPSEYSIHNVLLHMITSKAGLNFKKDIRTAVMAPSNMPYALAGGEIDAFIVAEPYGAQAECLNIGKVLLYSKDIWPEHICCVLMVKERWEKKHRAALQEFIDKLVDAGEFIESNSSSASHLGSHFLCMPENIVQKVLTSPKGRVNYHNLTPEKKDIYELHSYMTDKLKLLKTGHDMYESFDDTFAKEAYKKKKVK